ncbi:MAG: hypothetical protein AB8U44_02680 [Aaplasma endosymbiont of Hyalomma asiaticum]
MLGSDRSRGGKEIYEKRYLKKTEVALLALSAALMAISVRTIIVYSRVKDVAVIAAAAAGVLTSLVLFAAVIWKYGEYAKKSFQKQQQKVVSARINNSEKRVFYAAITTSTDTLRADSNVPQIMLDLYPELRQLHDAESDETGTIRLLRAYEYTTDFGVLCVAKQHMSYIQEVQCFEPEAKEEYLKYISDKPLGKNQTRFIVEVTLPRGVRIQSERPVFKPYGYRWGAREYALTQPAFPGSFCPVFYSDLKARSGASEEEQRSLTEVLGENIKFISDKEAAVYQAVQELVGRHPLAYGNESAEDESQVESKRAKDIFALIRLALGMGDAADSLDLSPKNEARITSDFIIPYSSISGVLTFAMTATTLYSILPFKPKTYTACEVPMYLYRNLWGVGAAEVCSRFASFLGDTYQHDMTLHEYRDLFDEFLEANLRDDILNDEKDVVNLKNIRDLEEKYGENWESIIFVLTTAIARSTTVEKVLKDRRTEEILEKADSLSIREQIASSIERINRNSKKQQSLGKLAYYSSLLTLYGAVKDVAEQKPDMSNREFISMCLLDETGHNKHPMGFFLYSHIASYCFDDIPPSFRIGNYVRDRIKVNIKFLDNSPVISREEYEEKEVSDPHVRIQRDDDVHPAEVQQDTHSSRVGNAVEMVGEGAIDHTAGMGVACGSDVESQPIIGGERSGSSSRHESGESRAVAGATRRANNPGDMESTQGQEVQQRPSSWLYGGVQKDSPSSSQGLSGNQPSKVPSSPTRQSEDTLSFSNAASRESIFSMSAQGSQVSEQSAPRMASALVQPRDTNSRHVSRGAASPVSSERANAARVVHTAKSARGSHSKIMTRGAVSGHSQVVNDDAVPGPSGYSSSGANRGSNGGREGGSLPRSQYCYQVKVLKKSKGDAPDVSADVLRAVTAEDMKFSGEKKGEKCLISCTFGASQYSEKSTSILRSDVVRDGAKMKAWVKNNVKDGEIAVISESKVESWLDRPKYDVSDDKLVVAGIGINCQSGDEALGVILSCAGRRRQTLESQYGLDEYLNFHREAYKQFISSDGSVKDSVGIVKYEQSNGGFGFLADVSKNIRLFKGALEMPSVHLTEDNRKFLQGVINSIGGFNDAQRRALNNTRGTPQEVFYQLFSSLLLYRKEILKDVQCEQSMMNSVWAWARVRDNACVAFFDRNYRQYYFSVVMHSIMCNFAKGEYGIEANVSDDIDAGLQGIASVAYLVALYVHKKEFPAVNYAERDRYMGLYSQIRAELPSFHIEGIREENLEDEVAKRKDKIREINKIIERNNIPQELREEARTMLLLSEYAVNKPDMINQLIGDLKSGDIAKYARQANMCLINNSNEAGVGGGRVPEAMAHAVIRDLSDVLKEQQEGPVLEKMWSVVAPKNRMRFMVNTAVSERARAGRRLVPDTSIECVFRPTSEERSVKILSIVNNATAKSEIYRKNDPSVEETFPDLQQENAQYASGTVNRVFQAGSSNSVVESGLVFGEREAVTNSGGSLSRTGQISSTYSSAERRILRKTGGDLWYIDCHLRIARDIVAMPCFGCANDLCEALLGTGLAIDVYDNLEKFKAISRDIRVSETHRRMLSDLCDKVEKDIPFRRKIQNAKSSPDYTGLEKKCGLFNGKLATSLYALSCDESSLRIQGGHTSYNESLNKLISAFILDKELRQAMLKYYILERCASRLSGEDMVIPAIFRLIPEFTTICDAVCDPYLSLCSWEREDSDTIRQELRARLNAGGIISPQHSEEEPLSKIAQKDHETIAMYTNGDSSLYSLLLAVKIVNGGGDKDIDDYISTSSHWKRETEGIANSSREVDVAFKVGQAIRRALSGETSKNFLGELVADAVMRSIKEIWGKEEKFNIQKFIEDLMRSTPKSKDALVEYCRKQNDTVNSGLFSSLLNMEPGIDQVLTIGMQGSIGSDICSSMSIVNAHQEESPATMLEQSRQSTVYSQVVR